mmetsp:Transcript_10413/g.10441  ORF Transcript_10413/g.10441 Transcript_10413/m.10441 type:complete len:102 (-) Transcript_10413:382-687(-)
MGKLEEYEKKVGTLEEKFDEAIDTSEKKFEVVDSQLQSIMTYLNKDKRSKEEILRQKREEITQREQEMQEKFAQFERQRFDIESNLTKLVDDKSYQVQIDL